MTGRDFAVVVGIARYPDLAAAGARADLDGPNNDAQAVYHWLVAQEGGALPPANVTLIRSADFDPVDPDDPQPARARIERALKRVEEQTRDDPGNRLYLYFSGHGFSPRLEEGALFTADATQTSPEYVFAHAWVRWFRRAQRFRQTVLWMDSCMNVEQSIPVNEVLMRQKIGTGVPGPAFMALAAQTKSALEYPMPDGQVHGVFTWTLLQGLRGGAADERGRVTGESLRSFLLTVMPEFLPDTARNSAAVDLYPFVRADDGIVFRRLPARPKYPVRLTFPPEAAGAELRIWTGRPLAQVTSEPLAGTEWSGELLRGLYVAEVPAAGLRHGFQVSGAGAVEETVTGTGPPVIVPDESELFAMDVLAGNPAASIGVSDYRFDRIFGDTGALHERDMPGVYKIRVEFGRDITMISEQVVLLDRDGLPGPVKAPVLASPAPVPGSVASRELHSAPFEAAAERREPVAAPGRSAISVLARCWTEPSGVAAAGNSAVHPMAGLELLDATGQAVAGFAGNGAPIAMADPDPVAVWEREVAPGNYFLRQGLRDGRLYEGCVTAAPDWVTQVVVKRMAGPDRFESVADVAVFMRRAGTHRTAEQDAAIEGARLALAEGRDVFADGHGAQLIDLLVDNFTDPIAGIIGGHLLLRAIDGGGTDPLLARRFDSLVSGLRSLVGTDHPDVEALSLRCTDAGLCTSGPFTAPPMFRHGWQLITDASYARPDLVPMPLWQRVHASVALGAFFIWAADARARDVHATQLSRVLGQYEELGDALDPPEPQIVERSIAIPPVRSIAPPPESILEAAPAAGTPLPGAVRDAAYRLQVPAAAAAALWAEREVPNGTGAAGLARRSRALGSAGRGPESD